jgi:hypothetical protein
MFTNEGDVALARRLNEALDTMPDDIDTDEAFVLVENALLADSEFCAEHGEWRDTAVREAIHGWLDNRTKVNITEDRATVAVEFTFPIEFTTLDGDARSALVDESEVIHAIIDEAVREALSLVEQRVGRIAGEWSGVKVDVIN